MDKSCPGALPDSLVPGLYYSYDACSDDQDALAACKWKNTESICINRTLDKTAIETSMIHTSSTFTTTTVNGVASFTDLSSANVGQYYLVVQAQPLSGTLIWKYDNLIGIRPSYARRMDIITLPSGALPGSPLQSQPTLKLTDSFGNLVFNDQICTAVTASVVSWAGKSISAFGLQSPKIYIYGQKYGDNNLYPAGCSTDPNLMCR